MITLSKKLPVMWQTLTSFISLHSENSTLNLFCHLPHSFCKGHRSLPQYHIAGFPHYKWLMNLHSLFHEAKEIQITPTGQHVLLNG